MFESYGVPVLAGIVADTPAEARAAAEKLGGVVVVKAQVKMGGRGKAGGVKVAKTPDEAEAAAEAILWSRHQGPHRQAGHGCSGRIDRQGVLLLCSA
jgi:succinyl-CoA synthetase beta subunit